MASGKSINRTRTPNIPKGWPDDAWIDALVRRLLREGPRARADQALLRLLRDLFANDTRGRAGRTRCSSRMDTRSEPPGRNDDHGR